MCASVYVLVVVVVACWLLFDGCCGLVGVCGCVLVLVVGLLGWLVVLCVCVLGGLIVCVCLFVCVFVVAA